MEIRKINLVAVALIGATLFWTSCTKEDDPVPTPEQSQEEGDDSTEDELSDSTSTDTNNNSDDSSDDETDIEVVSSQVISYKMDGIDVSLTKSSFFGSDNAYNTSTKDLLISRGEGGFSFDELNISIYDFDIDNLGMPATFTSDINNKGVSFDYYQALDQDGESSYFSHPLSLPVTPDFTLVLTSLEGNVAKGTFSGAVYDNDGKAHSITDGSFEMKFDRK